MMYLYIEQGFDKCVATLNVHDNVTGFSNMWSITRILFPLNFWTVGVLVAAGNIVKDQAEAGEELSTKQRVALAGGSAIGGTGEVLGTITEEENQPLVDTLDVASTYCTIASILLLHVNEAEVYCHRQCCERSGYSKGRHLTEGQRTGSHK